MMRFAGALALVLVGCGRGTVCEQADDIVADCTNATTPGTATTTWTVDGACAVGSVQECMSRCVLDAFDDGGCDAVTGVDRAGLLGCQQDCVDEFGTGATDSGTTP